VIWELIKFFVGTRMSMVMALRLPLKVEKFFVSFMADIFWKREFLRRVTDYIVLYNGTWSNVLQKAKRIKCLSKTPWRCTGGRGVKLRVLSSHLFLKVFGVLGCNFVWLDNCFPTFWGKILIYLECLKIYFLLLFLARQPPVGHGLLIHEVSRSHKTMQHSR